MPRQQLVNILHGNDHALSALRHMAADLLIEATERGDLDHATVTWAVARLLSAADFAESAVKVR